MQVEILQEDLAKGLTMVQRVVASKGQLPILANVLLEAENQGLALVATNLELGLRVYIGGKTLTEGSITIPAKQLAEFVSSLKPGTVQLTSEGENLKIVCGGYKAAFAGMSASEFPVVARLPEGSGTITLKKSIFADAAASVAFAAATDDTRPVLTGIQFLVTDGNLRMSATDGFRMSRKRISAPTGAEQLQNLLLPARTIIELARLAGEGRKEDIVVHVASGSNQVVFGYDKVQLTSRLLEGNFPDIERILPKEVATTTTFDRAELLSGVRAAGIFARESNNIVKFQISSSKFQVSAAGGQTGESQVDVEADVHGDEIEIAFNYRFVLDYLNSVNYERVRLETTGPLAPGVWKSETEDGSFHLIMPVRL